MEVELILVWLHEVHGVAEVGCSISSAILMPVALRNKRTVIGYFSCQEQEDL